MDNLIHQHDHVLHHEDDITKMLAATTHVGPDNSETTMEQYIFKKKGDGVNIINLRKTWEKMVLAARAIAAVENPADVFVVASRPFAQRACLKLPVILAPPRLPEDSLPVHSPIRFRPPSGSPDFLLFR